MTTAQASKNQDKAFLIAFVNSTFSSEGCTMKSPMLVKLVFANNLYFPYTHPRHVPLECLFHYKSHTQLLSCSIATSPLNHSPHWRADGSGNWKHPEGAAWLEQAPAQYLSHTCTSDGRTRDIPQPDPLVLVLVSLLQKTLTICKGATEVKLGSKMSQELAFHSTLLIQLQLSSSQFSGTLFLHSRAHSSQHQSVKKELRSPNQQLVAGLTQTVQAALHFGFDPMQFLHLGRSYTSTRWTQWSLWSSSIFYDSWYSFYVCFYGSP